MHFDSKRTDAEKRLTARLSVGLLLQYNLISKWAQASTDEMKIAIETHGCKLNWAESDQLAQALTRAGHDVVTIEETPDIYILNTCTVTHVADSKARQALRAVRRRVPGVATVPIGCYAQRAAVELSAIEGVVRVIGGANSQQVLSALAELEEGIRQDGLSASAETKERPHLRTRAFIKVQSGCRHACSYCVVRRIKGSPVSVPVESVLAQVKERVSEGYREVVLTGTQPGSYGQDLNGISLGALVGRILDETDVARVRVSSLLPHEIDPTLLALLGDERLCPHVHMPLQSGSAGVLRRMRRPYTLVSFTAAVEQLRGSASRMAVTTDIIVGFPGETEGEFAESLRFCEEMGFAKLHVFPFSPRPGTPASEMRPGIATAERAVRMGHMLTLARAMEERFLRRSVGMACPVLWEERREIGGRMAWSGLTDNYLRVYTESGRDLSNQITGARLLQTGDGVLWAKVLPP